MEQDDIVNAAGLRTKRSEYLPIFPRVSLHARV